jgi:hypothetical protein
MDSNNTDSTGFLKETSMHVTGLNSSRVENNLTYSYVLRWKWIKQTHSWAMTERASVSITFRLKTLKTMDNVKNNNHVYFWLVLYKTTYRILITFSRRENGVYTKSCRTNLILVFIDLIQLLRYGTRNSNETFYFSWKTTLYIKTCV